MAANRVSAEIPFGIAFNQFFCPACGASVVSAETGVAEDPCPHLRFVYIADVCEFAYLDTALGIDLQEAEKVADESKDDDWSPLDTVEKSIDEKAGILFEFTTGGMACGPVWSTIFIGIELVATVDAPDE